MSVTAIPAIVRILIILIFVPVAIRRKISRGNAFTPGTLLIGVFFGLQPSLMVNAVIAAIIVPKTPTLSAVITLLLVLSSSLELRGQMERLLTKSNFPYITVVMVLLFPRTTTLHTRRSS